jgi:NAD(P)-dependent dehydrogenase (short-subunit alcohol dehydrogenase family)
MRQTAIVSGGRRGIGRAIALKLAKSGYNVAISGKSPQSKDDTFSDIAATGADFIYIGGDISKAEVREQLITETVKRFGAIHVLVNNAGMAPRNRADLLDMTEESFDEVLGTNLKANMFLSQLAAKQMLKQEISGKKRGTIINISSCSAEVSSINRGEYCVSKAGVAMLTLLFADRLAREGIFVHEIRPGVISTDMTSGVQEKYDALIKAGTFPIARWGTPEDVADAVLTFAGDSFLYTTGNYIDVDGGFHIKRL